ncbi:hypothetical protein [Paenibacillus radicis (ex Xue et al. 2023)]|uniref:Uncharacterized protein n=1 Tax=Paenibacillus radicis (ex Xue et al. 2023) TaxID=2972489 RepID=A0ABT1YUW7_9BACL|nr:hypothetical protein [Paenibacillus radicis (ex Xue et al. 2023)]MCR8636705.1 hypothetical protein [Paenibacillus radicis (ex Xue et al. 2023)]
MARKTHPLLYRDEKYGFTLTFPRWWKPYTVIKKQKYDKDTEYELHFRFKYKGKTYDDIFALLVYKMTRKEWIKQGYEDSPLSFLAESDGHVFAYITPEELPEAFVDPKTGDYNYKKYGNAIRLLKRMVNQDVPRIVKTLHFSNTPSTIRSVPLRSKKVWPSGC